MAYSVKELNPSNLFFVIAESLDKYEEHLRLQRNFSEHTIRAYLGDLAALGAKQVGDRLQRRGLARAVGAEQRHDAALRHLERDPFQDEDDVGIDDLDVVDGEESLRPRRRGLAMLCLNSLHRGSPNETGGGARRLPNPDALSSPSSSRAR